MAIDRTDQPPSIEVLRRLASDESDTERVTEFRPAPSTASAPRREPSPMNADWLADAVLWEIYPQSFADFDGEASATCAG